MVLKMMSGEIQYFLKSPSAGFPPCFEFQCLFLKAFVVRPLSFCYCSWADWALPGLQPLWFGGRFTRIRTLGRGCGDRRPVPGTHLRFVSSHSHRCPSACCLLARMVLCSSWSAHLLVSSLNSLGSQGFEFSRFVLFCFLLPMTSSSPPAQSWFSPACGTEAILCIQLQKRD